MNCKYCNKKCKNERSNKQHEIRCHSNPDRIIVNPTFGMLGKKGKNQWIKAKENNTVYVVKEETRKKLSENSKKRIWTDEQRVRHSAIMKLAVEKNPNSYTSGNRGRTKQIIYDGIKFHGNWELDFYLWCIKNNIRIRKCEEHFEYEWKKKIFP